MKSLIFGFLDLYFKPKFWIVSIIIGLVTGAIYFTAFISELKDLAFWIFYIDVTIIAVLLAIMSTVSLYGIFFVESQRLHCVRLFILGILSVAFLFFGVLATFKQVDNILEVSPTHYLIVVIVYIGVNAFVSLRISALPD